MSRYTDILKYICLFILLQSCHSARILGVFPLPSRSHYILGSSLMRGLAEKGHEVTVISPFGEKVVPEKGKYNDVVLTDFLEDREKNNFNMFDLEKMNPVIYQLFMNFLGNLLVENTLNHTNVQKLIKSDTTFDVVIVEQFVNDALKAFAYHFNAHLVVFSTFGSNAWINPLIANPAPPSYVPEQTITYTEFNFVFRLKNTFINILGELNRHWLFFPQQNQIMKKYFPNIPDLSLVNYNTSLVLLNSHISTNQAVPRVPCMVDIGGYHIQPPKKLPQDLQQFLDEATEGVIYFSMGSGLRSADLPLEKRQAFLNTFAKLKMKVLWKWEEDVLPGQPSNVKLGKWLPQQDILAHPNVKLFITHGGLLSLIETVYHGKPVLAIPIFGDQKINAVNVLWYGYGICLYLDEVTEDRLYKSLNELLSNPKFEENVRKRSQIFHDRPLKPMDLADFWIKHIIKHGGQHLRVAGLDMAWYQYLGLDVLAFVLTVILLLLYIVFIFLKFLFGEKSAKVKTS